MNDHDKFKADMDEARIAYSDYNGRGGWKGPAVRTDDPEEVMASTTVICQKDQMGKGWIVYPRAHANEIVDTFI